MSDLWFNQAVIDALAAYQQISDAEERLAANDD